VHLEGYHPLFEFTWQGLVAQGTLQISFKKLNFPALIGLPQTTPKYASISLRQFVRATAGVN
jgi:hypothetical protein